MAKSCSWVSSCPAAPSCSRTSSAVIYSHVRMRSETSRLWIGARSRATLCRACLRGLRTQSRPSRLRACSTICWLSSLYRLSAARSRASPRRLATSWYVQHHHIAWLATTRLLILITVVSAHVAERPSRRRALEPRAAHPGRAAVRAISKQT